MTDKWEGNCASFKNLDSSWYAKYARNVTASATFQHIKQNSIQNPNQQRFYSSFIGCEDFRSDQQKHEVTHSLTLEIPCTHVL